jgi:trehalose/maltose hydrolase-like predicted phosphorylase
MKHPVVKFRRYDPQDERRRESLMSLGNGFLVVRSALPWGSKNGSHYAGTYAAGRYNSLPSAIAGETVWDDTIVNLPNAFSLSIRVDDESPLTVKPETISAYEQELDLRSGIMRRTIVLKDTKGRTTEIREERFVSMSNPNTIGMRLSFAPRDWTGTLSISSAIDGTVINGNIEKHKDFSRRHLSVKLTETSENGMRLVAETSRPGFRVDVDAVVAVTPPASAVPAESGNETAQLKFAVPATPEAPVVFEQLATITIDGATDSPTETRRKVPGDVSSYTTLRQDHVDAWQDLWRDMAFQSEDDEISLAVQLTLFHLLQNYSPNTVGRDAGFPARGWQEVYRGQIFWDEMFAIPVFSLRFPALAREMLLYRYARLEEARKNARRRGLKGALYPWRSARSGAEVTPRFQKFMKSGRWHEDHTDLQVHINGAIAWNIFQYSWAAGDRDFLEGPGLEMLVEQARLWASLAIYDDATERFHIRGIVGADEFHTHHIDSDDPGLRDNAYTNMLAVWMLAQLLALIDETPSQRLEALGVTDAEVTYWDHLSRRLNIAFGPSGMVSQFADVEALPELDPDQFGDANAQWELEAQGRDANDYQIFKQADFAMLLYLFRADELIGLFERLGYDVTRDQLHRSLDHYRHLTTHTSSLSETSYAAGLSFFDKVASWEMWRKAMAPDLDPAHAGGTAEGLHLGAMAASLDTLQRRYLGLMVDAHGLRLEPELLDELPPLRFTFMFRGGRYELRWNSKAVTISACERNAEPLVCFTRGGRVIVAPGQAAEIWEHARTPAVIL